MLMNLIRSGLSQPQIILVTAMTELELIGLDPLGRPVSIHRSTNDDGQLLFASNVHDWDGRCGWGIISDRLDDFDRLTTFPTIKTIWEAPSYNYAAQAQRYRIYSIAIHHTIKMRS